LGPPLCNCQSQDLLVDGYYQRSAVMHTTPPHSLAIARRCRSFADEGDPLTLRGSLWEGSAPRAPEQNFRQKTTQRQLWRSSR